MLTAAQCEIVAAMEDGAFICKKCADEKYGDGWPHLSPELADKLGIHALIEFEASSDFGEDGLWCDACGEVIVEPPAKEEEEKGEEDNG